MKIIYLKIKLRNIKKKKRHKNREFCQDVMGWAIFKGKCKHNYNPGLNGKSRRCGSRLVN